MNTMQSVLRPMIRKIAPQLISSQIVGVQPMSYPHNSLLRKLEKLVCDTVSILQETWDDEFTNDLMIMRPMIWCLQKLSYLTSYDDNNKLPDSSSDDLGDIEAEYWTAMAWIVQNHHAIAFDLELRGINTQRPV